MCRPQETWREMSLWSQQKTKVKMRTQELSAQHFTSNQGTNRLAKIQSSPLVMPRKVADVFVVMKGQVPDSIFKNNNTTTNNVLRLK